MKRGLRDRRAALLLAAFLFALVTASCFAVRGALLEGIPLLEVLPIALVALARGPRGGLVAAGAGMVLLVLWAVADGVEVGAVGYLTRAVVFLVAGGLPGLVPRRGPRAAGADSRWFEMSNDMLVEASLDGYFTRLSTRWETCLGWTREELMARPFRELVHPDDLVATNVHADALEERPGEVFNFENRYLAKDGSWRWLLWSARSDEHRKYAVARDITDRKRLEEERQELLLRLERTARTDDLTGLPNRRAWNEEVRLALARARRLGHSLSLAIIDLDDFKRFNDTYGHAAGDAFLADAAAGWRGTLRSTDCLARYGGEEFAVLLPDCSPEEAGVLLERLRRATPAGQTCSVGIARWERADRPEDLLARADAALYEAKRRGRDRVVTAC